MMPADDSKQVVGLLAYISYCVCVCVCVCVSILHPIGKIMSILSDVFVVACSGFLETMAFVPDWKHR